MASPMRINDEEMDMTVLEIPLEKLMNYVQLLGDYLDEMWVGVKIFSYLSDTSVPITLFNSFYYWPSNANQIHEWE